MKSYPVRVSFDPYRGANPNRLRKSADYNRVAARIEKFLNDQLANEPDDTVRQFFSRTIAADLREDEDLVQRVVFSIDCGHNGVTIVKGNFERAMERLANPPREQSAENSRARC
ncbi:hypothetical protein OGR47_21210 (plasmid) [Methylocystis sp. MJC1]|uniref:hypothetical protein n=1 Tax=Methylocystis sp. MJC1 TaxID=2654282 RepID=UPI0013EB5F94|nr:hypothetical protein [Methylocystis sp. MJC1]KAF2988815.1 hypothetical protein MJC1_04106 [Methylocystis sp. MJC1]MBU6529412.1 hypothetical protein [Methylocystis sp. MJC1]UZX14145.1 hypothetical protein OGR47_21210 [Methylocystis sp. MJC1]